MESLILMVIFVIGIFVLLFLFRRPPKKTKVKRSFGIMSETNKGEIVRSKAEKQVADYLHDKEIEYIYEKTIEVGRQKHKIKYDFYLPHDDTYVEYWGLEKAEKEISEKYTARKEEKIHLYNKYNLKLVSLYPEDLSDIDTIFPLKLSEADRRHRSLWRRFMEWLKFALFLDDGAIHITDTNSDITDLKKENIIFCIKCGNQISSSDPFCTECGTQNE